MQKGFSGGVKEWMLIVAGAIALLAALLLPLRMALAQAKTTDEEQLLTALEKGEIIRIHVLANSDSVQDQTVKLEIRDALIEAFGKLLAQAGANSSEAAYQVLSTHMPAMQQTAQACAEENGFFGNVRAECGLLSLPEKQYGSIVLPDGKYRGLRITIGEGRGQNWWCVLYPQLCLALAESNEPSKDLYWSSLQIFRNWLMTF